LPLQTLFSPFSTLLPNLGSEPVWNSSREFYVLDSSWIWSKGCLGRGLKRMENEFSCIFLGFPLGWSLISCVLQWVVTVSFRELLFTGLPSGFTTTSSTFFHTWPW
jgi:hypothetical protein